MNTYKNDELMHYCVLVIKCGVHRSRVNMEKSKKARSKGDIDKAEMYKAKSEKIKSKHMKRVGGKSSYDYSSNENLGKSFAKSMIFGTYGALKYNEAKAKTKSTGKAFVNGALYAY